MKKSHFRPLVLAFLMFASLASYIYLKNIPVEEYQEIAIEEGQEFDQNDLEETKILLADIALVKKIIGLTKLILEKN